MTSGRPIPAALQEHPNREDEQAQNRDEDGPDDGDQAANQAQSRPGPDLGQRRAWSIIAPTAAKIAKRACTDMVLSAWS
jgi:hypothetical protein